MASDSKVLLEYLDLGAVGGRGGVSRFFLLANDVEFEEKLYSMDDVWKKRKAELISSGFNPTGQVPIITIGDKSLTQHIASLRYVSRALKLTDGSDPWNEYVQDLVADEYHKWRAQWVDAAFGSDEVKANYKNKELPNHLDVFNKLYLKYKTKEPFLSSTSKGRPLWGDSAVFGVIYDSCQTGLLAKADLEKYRALQDMYTEYERIPAVAKWIKSMQM